MTVADTHRQTQGDNGARATARVPHRPKQQQQFLRLTPVSPEPTGRKQAPTCPPAPPLARPLRPTQRLLALTSLLNSSNAVCLLANKNSLASKSFPRNSAELRGGGEGRSTGSAGSAVSGVVSRRWARVGGAVEGRGAKRSVATFAMAG